MGGGPFFISKMSLAEKFTPNPTLDSEQSYLLRFST